MVDKAAREPSCQHAVAQEPAQPRVGDALEHTLDEVEHVDVHTTAQTRDVKIRRGEQDVSVERKLEGAAMRALHHRRKQRFTGRLDAGEAALQIAARLGVVEGRDFAGQHLAGKTRLHQRVLLGQRVAPGQDEQQPGRVRGRCQLLQSLAHGADGLDDIQHIDLVLERGLFQRVQHQHHALARTALHQRACHALAHFSFKCGQARLCAVVGQWRAAMRRQAAPALFGDVTQQLKKRRAGQLRVQALGEFAEQEHGRQRTLGVVQKIEIHACDRHATRQAPARAQPAQEERLAAASGRVHLQDEALRVGEQALEIRQHLAPLQVAPGAEVVVGERRARAEQAALARHQAGQLGADEAGGLAQQVQERLTAREIKAFAGAGVELAPVGFGLTLAQHEAVVELLKLGVRAARLEGIG